MKTNMRKKDLKCVWYFFAKNIVSRINSAPQTNTKLSDYIFLKKKSRKFDDHTLKKWYKSWISLKTFKSCCELKNQLEKLKLHR